MCVIIVKKRGVKAPECKILEKCELNNPHGVGIAYAKNGRVFIKKDFLGAKALDVFLKKNITDDIPAMIHFRLATHGVIEKGQRHPFPVVKNYAHIVRERTTTDLALAHNGVIRGYGNEAYSDTIKFIVSVLSDSRVRNGIFTNAAVCSLIESAVTGDRLAFLNAAGEFVLLNSWTAENGLFYSNMHWNAVHDSIGFRDSYGCNYRAPVYRAPTYQLESGKCEICNSRVKVARVHCAGADWILCKKCRRSLRGNKLILPR